MSNTNHPRSQGGQQSSQKLHAVLPLSCFRTYMRWHRQVASLPKRKRATYVVAYELSQSSPKLVPSSEKTFGISMAKLKMSDVTGVRRFRLLARPHTVPLRLIACDTSQNGSRTENSISCSYGTVPNRSPADGKTPVGANTTSRFPIVLSRGSSNRDYQQLASKTALAIDDTRH